MTPFLQLAFSLAVILFAAKLGGYAANRLHQPSVFGELLVGLILGPSLLDLTHLSIITDPHLQEIIIELGELGVLMLMFVAGLELHLSDLASNSRASAFAGTLGVVVPLALGYGFGAAGGMETNQAVFIGLILSATSVSISAQTLLELKALRSRVGLALMGAAVFDDILAILALSTFLALSESSGYANILNIFLRMLIYLLLSAGFGLYILPYLTRLTARLSISQGVTTLAIIILLLYGITAEIFGGMAAITGTFLAGLMFGRTRERSEVEHGLHSITYSFFVPIFFITIGFNINIHTLQPSLFGSILILSLIAILGKVIGAGLGARLGGFDWTQSLQLAIGMISRGEVGLIVAQVGLKTGVLTIEFFSAFVGVILITTLVTPPLLKWSFTRLKAPASPAP